MMRPESAPVSNDTLFDVSFLREQTLLRALFYSSLDTPLLCLDIRIIQGSYLVQSIEHLSRLVAVNQVAPAHHD
jgi:hypothetical protein